MPEGGRGVRQGGFWIRVLEEGAGDRDGEQAVGVGLARGWFGDATLARGWSCRPGKRDIGRGIMDDVAR